MRRINIIPLLLLSFWMMKNQADEQHTPTLSVSETASIEVMPDYLVFIVEIEEVKPTKAKAKELVDQIAGKVLNTLKKFNIDDDHIEASQINAQPKYNWSKSERVYEGEQVNRTVRVKLYAKDKYTDLVTAISKLDVSQYYQQSFGYDNLDEHKNKALLLAIERARKKASLIAKAFNTSVDRALEITENTSHGPHPLRMMSMEYNGRDAKESAPLEIKPQEISANISVVFTLTP